MASLLFTIALGTNGTTLAGVSVYSHDIAPQFAAIIFAIGATAGNIAGLVGIWGTGLLLELTNSWDCIFWVSILQFIFGAWTWYIFAVGPTPLPSLRNPEEFQLPRYLSFLKK